MARQLKEDGNTKRMEQTIAVIFGEAVFLSTGQIEDDGLESKDVYVEFGNESPEIENG